MLAKSPDAPVVILLNRVGGIAVNPVQLPKVPENNEVALDVIWLNKSAGINVKSLQ